MMLTILFQCDDQQIVILETNKKLKTIPYFIKKG